MHFSLRWTLSVGSKGGCLERELTVRVQERVKKFLLCFTSFSGHRPAQRECAQTGLRSHARCHPYPIPQPIKVDHTTGVYNPYSFWIVMWVFLHPTRTNQWKCCECWSSWGLNPWPPARQTGSLKIYEAPKLQKASPPHNRFSVQKDLKDLNSRNKINGSPAEYCSWLSVQSWQMMILILILYIW